MKVVNLMIEIRATHRPTKRIESMKVGDRAAAPSWAIWQGADGKYYADGFYPLLNEGTDPETPFVHLHMTEAGLITEGYFEYPQTDLRLGDPTIPVISYRQIGDWTGPLYKGSVGVMFPL